MVPRVGSGWPCTSAWYRLSTVRSLNARLSTVYARSLFATTIRPVVPASSRCTTPCRSAAPGGGDPDSRPRRARRRRSGRSSPGWGGRRRRPACRRRPGRRPRAGRAGRSTGSGRPGGRRRVGQVDLEPGAGAHRRSRRRVAVDAGVARVDRGRPPRSGRTRTAGRARRRAAARRARPVRADGASAHAPRARSARPSTSTPRSASSDGEDPADTRCRVGDVEDRPVLRPAERADPVDDVPRPTPGARNTRSTRLPSAPPSMQAEGDRPGDRAQPAGATAMITTTTATAIRVRMTVKPVPSENAAPELRVCVEVDAPPSTRTGAWSIGRFATTSTLETTSRTSAATATGRTARSADAPAGECVGPGPAGLRSRAVRRSPGHSCAVGQRRSSRCLQAT